VNVTVTSYWLPRIIQKRNSEKIIWRKGRGLIFLVRVKGREVPWAVKTDAAWSSRRMGPDEKGHRQRS